MLRLPYSPECVEVEFCELRVDGVLGSWSRKFQISLIWGMRLVTMLARLGAAVDMWDFSNPTL
jgi:hypothetical protein